MRSSLLCFLLKFCLGTNVKRIFFATYDVAISISISSWSWHSLGKFHHSTIRCSELDNSLEERLSVSPVHRLVAREERAAGPGLETAGWQTWPPVVTVSRDKTLHHTQSSKQSHTIILHPPYPHLTSYRTVLWTMTVYSEDHPGCEVI